MHTISKDTTKLAIMKCCSCQHGTNLTTISKPADFLGIFC
jgi:hypothetical protein